MQILKKDKIITEDIFQVLDFARSFRNQVHLTSNFNSSERPKLFTELADALVELIETYKRNVYAQAI